MTGAMGHFKLDKNRIATFNTIYHAHRLLHSGIHAHTQLPINHLPEAALEGGISNEHSNEDLVSDEIDSSLPPVLYLYTKITCVCVSVHICVTCQQKPFEPETNTGTSLD